MALFKILKGPEAALPTAKKEGWAYVTNEGNFYVDISDSLRVKINQNADYATKATNDSANQKITDTYIKDVIYNQSGTAPYYTLRLGNGNLKATNGTTDKVIIPVANTDDAGVVTTGEQFFAGAKIFNALITAKSGLASDENITTQKQLVSTIADGTAPLVVSSKTLVTNLNADTVDGLHASNNLFNAENSSTTILPTQRAIWSSLNDLLVAAHALVYRGLIDPTNSSTHPNKNSVGDVYIISKEGTFAGVYCEPGDLAIYYASGWDIVQTNINGAVVIKNGGAYNTAHATANAIARFDDTTGRVIKNSAVTIDNNGHIVPAVNNTQNLGSKDFIWNTIYGTSFTGLANQATHDDAGQVIQNTYIKEIVYVQDDDVKPGSEASPYLRYKYGHGKDPVYLAIPTAGAQKGGILTSGAQEISGAKTLNATDGSLTIPKADSFIYSGIQSDSAAGTTKYVWFSTTGGIPKYNTKFAFNPSCTTKWDSYDGTTVTAYTQLTVDRLFGIAFKALQDDSGQNINDTYIKNIEFVKDNATIAGSLSNPYLRFFVGNGNATNLAIPPATATGGGILTAAAQEIGGAKTLNKDTGSLTIPKANGFTYSGIQADTAAGTTKYVWFSTTGGVPKYNTKFAFDPACTTAWASFDTGTTATAYTQLTVDRVNGIAFKALQDDSGQNINDTYIKNIEFIKDNATINGSLSNPYLRFAVGNGNVTNVIIPAATSNGGGIITAGEQTITGKKIINAAGGLEVQGTSAFDFSGIEEGGSSVDRVVWFAHSDRKGTPVYNDNFTYNPAKSVTWDHDSQAVTKGVLTVDRVDGLAKQALQDSQGFVIDDTYIKAIEFIVDNETQAGSVSNPYLKYTLGNGADITKIALPAASASQGGILNADAQEIKGKKTFNDGIAAKLTSTDADATHYLWFSTINTANGIGTPVYDTGLTYNAKTGILTTTTFKGALDGLAAQATADAKNQNIADTYIKDIEYANYIFSIKLGNGTKLKDISPAFAASDSCGGDAKKAKTWSNNLKLELIGEVTGSATFDGDEGTVKLTTSLANSNLTALDGRYIRKDQADGTAYTLTLSNTTDLNSTNISTAQGALIVKGAVHVAKQIYASKVHNAVWNDYAECRKAETIEPGRVVIEHESGEMKVSSERLQAGGSIISDTYGSCMGETAECKTPIAVAGRVLVYTYEDRNTYPLGAAVCTAPNGTVSVMTREEIREYPERILGTVSEIPDYEVWGTGNIQVNNRIWIKVR